MIKTNHAAERHGRHQNPFTAHVVDKVFPTCTRPPHTCERRLSSVVASFSMSCMPSTTTRRATPARIRADK